MTRRSVSWSPKPAPTPLSARRYVPAAIALGIGLTLSIIAFVLVPLPAPWDAVDASPPPPMRTEHHAETEGASRRLDLAEGRGSMRRRGTLPLVDNPRQKPSRYVDDTRGGAESAPPRVRGTKHS